LGVFAAAPEGFLIESEETFAEGFTPALCSLSVEEAALTTGFFFFFTTTTFFFSVFEVSASAAGFLCFISVALGIFFFSSSSDIYSLQINFYSSSSSISKLIPTPQLGQAVISRVIGTPHSGHS
jgi:hypothetical protein